MARIDLHYGDYVVAQIPLTDVYGGGFTLCSNDVKYTVCTVGRHSKKDVNPMDYKVRLVPLNKQFVNSSWYANDIFGHGSKAKSFGDDLDAATLYAFYMNNVGKEVKTIIKNYEDKHMRIVMKKYHNSEAKYVVETNRLFDIIPWMWHNASIDVEFGEEDNYRVTSYTAAFNKLSEAESYVFGDRIKNISEFDIPKPNFEV